MKQESANRQKKYVATSIYATIAQVTEKNEYDIHTWRNLMPNTENIRTFNNMEKPRHMIAS